MAARSAWSGLVLVDNVSGKPLSNGKINFWTNGTTNDLDTFPTVALSGANANPLILDANGRVPEAWSNDTDVYAVRILDENDNVILSTVQDISFIAPFTLSSADVLAALAANSAAVDIAGSSMVGSAFAAFADNLDLTAAGSIDASAGAITLGTVTGPTTFADVFVADGSGLVIGHTAQVAVDGVTSETEILGTASADSSMSIQRYSADAPGPEIYLFKSRGVLGVVGSSVNNNDELGAISFLGDDGTDSATKAARILARIDGTPGTGDLPTELVFQTGDGGSLSDVLTLSPALAATFAGAVSAQATTVTTLGGTGALSGFTTMDCTQDVTVTGTAVNPLNMIKTGTGGTTRITFQNSADSTTSQLRMNWDDGFGRMELFAPGDAANGAVIWGSATEDEVLLRTANTDRVTIDSSGDLTIASLAGTGSRTVVADANGKISAP